MSTVSLNGSVSVLIEGVKAGCESAATRLWARYCNPLFFVARHKLEGEPKTVADEEDVVVTAFHSFLRRCRAGNYPDIRRRDELWKLLFKITLHKANNQIRNRIRQKRMEKQSGAVCHLRGPCVSTWDGSVGTEVPVQIDGMVAEALDHLLTILSDGSLRTIVLYKLEGYSNQEIARKIGRSLPTVERRLRLIRDRWRKELD